MERFDDIAQLSKIDSPLCIAAGVFDGLHIGHQAVLARTMAEAHRNAALPLLLSFDPHPAKILRPEAAPRILTHTRHKLRLAAGMGMKAALVIPFDLDFASRSAESFIRDLAEAATDLRHICVGQDWRFGKNRSGDLEALQRLGRDLNFEATGIQPVEHEGVTVSSTRIRAMIREGHLDAVKPLLGRSYTVFGQVIEGRQLGRELGFPTANLAVFDEQLPPGGVYVVHACRNGTVYDGIANLGSRPTIAPGGTQRLLEVHLIDYHGPDFYDSDLEVTFVRFLRPERRFPDLDALKAQIAEDLLSARAIHAESTA